jgi:hypothetical protein
VPRPLRLGLFALVALVPVGPLAAQGQYTPVTEDEVIKMKLNHYFTPDKKSHAPDFEWTFTKTEFVLKKGKGAIPADLLGRLLPDGKAADEVRGKWALDGKGRLTLTEIKAGDTAGKKDVSLPICKTAPTVIRIGETQYVFSLLP